MNWEQWLLKVAYMRKQLPWRPSSSALEYSGSSRIHQQCTKADFGGIPRSQEGSQHYWASRSAEPSKKPNNSIHLKKTTIEKTTYAIRYAFRRGYLLLSAAIAQVPHARSLSSQINADDSGINKNEEHKVEGKQNCSLNDRAPKR